MCQHALCLPHNAPTRRHPQPPPPQGSGLPAPRPVLGWCDRLFLDGKCADPCPRSPDSRLQNCANTSLLAPSPSPLPLLPPHLSTLAHTHNFSCYSLKEDVQLCPAVAMLGLYLGLPQCMHRHTACITMHNAYITTRHASWAAANPATNDPPGHAAVNIHFLLTYGAVYILVCSASRLNEFSWMYCCSCLADIQNDYAPGLWYNMLLLDLQGEQLSETRCEFTIHQLALRKRQLECSRGKPMNHSECPLFRDVMTTKSWGL